MSNLNAWQKVTWVIPGKPFGDAIDGDVTVSADPNTRATVTGTAGGNPTLGSGILANGDLCMIIQMENGTPGQWEYNMVSSGGGTTTPTMKKPLTYTYAADAQIIKIPRYKTATISSFSVPAYNGTVGGVVHIVARVAISGSGTITGTGLGFRGGGSQTEGEGTGGTQTTISAANGNGGGGGSDHKGAGGGGNGVAGTTGSLGPGGSDPGIGGSITSVSDGTKLIMGGGGGGANGQGTAGTGGTGGALICLVSKSISGITLANNGTNGDGSSGDSNDGGGSGGGAGGTNFLVCQTASLGSSSTASKGTGGTSAAGSGGNGGDGQNIVHHSGTISGTMTPTFTDISDSTLKEVGGLLSIL